MVLILSWFLLQTFITFYYINKFEKEGELEEEKYFGSLQFLRSRKLKFIVTLLFLFIFVSLFLVEIYFDIERNILLQLCFVLFAYLDNRSWKELQHRHKNTNI